MGWMHRDHARDGRGRRSPGRIGRCGRSENVGLKAARAGSPGSGSWRGGAAALSRRTLGFSGDINGLGPLQVGAETPSCLRR